MGLLTTKAGTFPWTQNMPKGNADGVVALVNAAREEVEFIELLLRAADKLDFLPGAHQDLSDGLRYEAQKLMDNER